MNITVTRLASILVLGSLLMACSDSNNNDPQVDQGLPNPFAGFVSDLYSGGDNWLCHPALADVNNVCARNLDTTRVSVSSDFLSGTIVGIFTVWCQDQRIAPPELAEAIAGRHRLSLRQAQPAATLQKR